MAGKDYPVLLSKKSIQNHKLLVGALASSVAADIEVVDEDAVTPSILDTTCKAYIDNVIANEIHSTGMEIGLDRLGWDKSNTQFSSLSWRASSSGLSYEPRTSYPGEEGFESFEYREIVCESPVDISNECQHLFGLISSVIIHYRNSTSLNPIVIRDTPDNRSKLFASLYALSQKSPIILNNNFRKNTNYLSFVYGHPVVCIAPNSQVLNKINEPVIVLSEQGMDLSCIGDSTESITNFSQWVIPSLLKDLCEKPLSSLGSRSLDSLKIPDLIIDGSRRNALLANVPAVEESEFLKANSHSANIVNFTQDTGTESSSEGSTSTSIPSI